MNKSEFRACRTAVFASIDLLADYPVKNKLSYSNSRKQNEWRFPQIHKFKRDASLPTGGNKAGRCNNKP